MSTTNQDIPVLSLNQLQAIAEVLDARAATAVNSGAAYGYRESAQFVRDLIQSFKAR